MRDLTDRSYLPYLNKDKTCQNIRSLIAESGMTHQEIADKTLQNRGTVYKWASNNVPSIDNMIALAYVLGVKTDDILVTDLRGI